MPNVEANREEEAGEEPAAENAEEEDGGRIAALKKRTLRVSWLRDPEKRDRARVC